LFIWGFSLLTGAAPCVLRAAVMFSFLIVAKAYSQEVNVYNVLGSSTLVLLLWNPYFLYDVGFQLSYIGLAGILYFQPKIYEKGNEYIDKIDWLFNLYTFRFNDFKPKNKWILAVIKFPVAKYLWELTSVSFAATIAVTPLSLFYFHQFPTWFVLSGMIVVPISAIALYIGIALFIFHPISTFIAKIIGKFLFGAIWLLNNSLFVIDKIPPGAIKHLWISGVTTLLIYLLIAFWIKKINSKEFKWLFTGGSLALILTSVHHNYVAANHLQQKEITIYNTGFYTLIDCIEGEKSYAISTKDIPQRTINFAAYNYRLSKNIKPDDVEVVEIQDSLQTETFSYQNACLEFGGKKLTLLSNAPIDTSIKIQTDYLFIRDNPKIKIDKLMEKIDFKALIFDASNKRYKVEEWKTYCNTHQIPFHDITENYLTIKIR
jgi:competence protein ComEC